MYVSGAAIISLIKYKPTAYTRRTINWYTIITNIMYFKGNFHISSVLRNKINYLYRQIFDIVWSGGRTLHLGPDNSRERGQQAVYYTSPQSFINKFSYSLA